MTHISNYIHFFVYGGYDNLDNVAYYYTYLNIDFTPR